jgi:hypothetical protein
MNSAKGRKRRASTDNKGRNLRKRPKISFEEQDSQDLNDEAQDWFSVSTILDERKRPGKPREYKVLWEPNPVTGETYSPTWEVELTEDLLAEWREKSRKRSGDQADGNLPHSQAAFLGGDDSLQSNSTTLTPTSPTLNKKALRRNRVIKDSSDRESSAAASSPRRTSLEHAPPNQATDPGSNNPAAEVIAEDGIGTGNQPRPAIANVFITRRSDFARDEYLAGLSQVSQQTEIENQLWGSQSLHNDRQPERQPSHARLEIPDSQSQYNTANIVSSPVIEEQVSKYISQRLSCCLDPHGPAAVARHHNLARNKNRSFTNDASNSHFP